MSDTNRVSKISLSQKIHAGVLLNIPIYLHGNVGIGKTTSVYDVCRHLSMDHYTIVASRYEPTYFGGYPFVKDEDVLMSKPKFVKQLEKHTKPVVLFLDEFSTTQRATQNSLLTVIQEKKAGDWDINPQTRFIAAGNFVDVAGNTILNPAMANRFLHIFHTPDIDEWINSLSNNIKVDFAHNPNWRDDIKYYESLVVDFADTYYKSNPEYFATMPSSFSSVQDYAFSTPRSLTSSAKILALCGMTDIELCKELLKGMIGSTAAIALLSHINSKKKLEKFTEIDLNGYRFSNDPSQVTVLLRSAAMYATEGRYADKAIELFKLAFDDGYTPTVSRYAETLARNVASSDHPVYSVKEGHKGQIALLKKLPFIVDLFTFNVKA